MASLGHAQSPLFLPGDDPAVRAAIAASMAATPQHVLASAFGSHLIDFDAAAAAAACKLPIAYIGCCSPDGKSIEVSRILSAPQGWPDLGIRPLLHAVGTRAG